MGITVAWHKTARNVILLEAPTGWTAQHLVDATQQTVPMLQDIQKAAVVFAFKGTAPYNIAPQMAEFKTTQAHKVKLVVVVCTSSLYIAKELSKIYQIIFQPQLDIQFATDMEQANIILKRYGWLKPNAPVSEFDISPEQHAR